MYNKPGTIYALLYQHQVLSKMFMLYWLSIRASHGYRLTAVLPVICLTAVNRLAFTSGGLTG